MGGRLYRMEQQGERQMEEVGRIRKLTVPEVGEQDREVVRRREGVVVQPEEAVVEVYGRSHAMIPRSELERRSRRREQRWKGQNEG